MNIISGQVDFLKKEHPDWYKEDLGKLFQLLGEDKIKPLLFAFPGKHVLFCCRGSEEYLSHEENVPVSA